MISFNSFAFTVWPLSSALNLVHLFLRDDVFVSDNEMSVLLPCTIALGFRVFDERIVLLSAHDAFFCFIHGH